MLSCLGSGQQQEFERMTEVFAQRPSIGLVLHPARDTTHVVREVNRWATRVGREVVRLGTEGLPPQVPRGWTLASQESARCGLVIAVGGDGTVLRAFDLVSPWGGAVLGVNLGRLGFLSEVDGAGLADALEAVERNTFRIEKRTAVNVSVSGHTAVAYNDAVLTRVPGAGQAALEVQVGGEVFARYSADALVVSTPTGSTAYNFAAGGPIVSPTIAALIVTAVAPHGIFNRSVVVDPLDDVVIDIMRRSSPVALEVDGRAVTELQEGDRVAVAVSETSARVLRVTPATFYGRVRERLGLHDPVAIAAASGVDVVSASPTGPTAGDRP
jgi:NAD+ kinase